MTHTVRLLEALARELAPFDHLVDVAITTEQAGEVVVRLVVDRRLPGGEIVRLSATHRSPFGGSGGLTPEGAFQIARRLAGQLEAAGARVDTEARDAAARAWRELLELRHVEPLAQRATTQILAGQDSRDRVLVETLAIACAELQRLRATATELLAARPPAPIVLEAKNVTLPPSPPSLEVMRGYAAAALNEAATELERAAQRGESLAADFVGRLRARADQLAPGLRTSSRTTP